MTVTARLPHDWEPSDGTLADRIILITGAADGIGRALARSCAKHGATVILLDRNVRGLEQAYDEILAAGHREPALYPLDLQAPPPTTTPRSRRPSSGSSDSCTGWCTMRLFSAR